uniref:Putative dentin sialophosphoprotein n=1 Tax=Toxoplasma gondii COUG TaxID=1074873 RepID=A0A2G8Y5C7_TOXGO|nr:putative dentin sialophosphoprotein [Toxoplasma gondii COUG]
MAAMKVGGQKACLLVSAALALLCMTGLPAPYTIVSAALFASEGFSVKASDNKVQRKSGGTGWAGIRTGFRKKGKLFSLAESSPDDSDDSASPATNASDPAPEQGKGRSTENSRAADKTGVSSSLEGFSFDDNRSPAEKGAPQNRQEALLAAAVGFSLTLRLLEQNEESVITTPGVLSSVVWATEALNNVAKSDVGEDMDMQRLAKATDHIVQAINKLEDVFRAWADLERSVREVGDILSTSATHNESSGPPDSAESSKTIGNQLLQLGDELKMFTLAEICTATERNPVSADTFTPPTRFPELPQIQNADHSFSATQELSPDHEDSDSQGGTSPLFNATETTESHNPTTDVGIPPELVVPSPNPLQYVSTQRNSTISESANVLASSAPQAEPEVDQNVTTVIPPVSLINSEVESTPDDNNPAFSAAANSLSTVTEEQEVISHLARTQSSSVTRPIHDFAAAALPSQPSSAVSALENAVNSFSASSVPVNTQEAVISFTEKNGETWLLEKRSDNERSEESSTRQGDEAGSSVEQNEEAAAEAQVKQNGDDETRAADKLEEEPGTGKEEQDGLTDEKKEDFIEDFDSGSSAPPLKVDGKSEEEDHHGGEEGTQHQDVADERAKTEDIPIESARVSTETRTGGGYPPTVTENNVSTDPVLSEQLSSQNGQEHSRSTAYSSADGAETPKERFVSHTSNSNREPGRGEAEENSLALGGNVRGEADVAAATSLPPASVEDQFTVSQEQDESLTAMVVEDHGNALDAADLQLTTPDTVSNEDGQSVKEQTTHKEPDHTHFLTGTPSIPRHELPENNTTSASDNGNEATGYLNEENHGSALETRVSLDGSSDDLTVVPGDPNILASASQEVLESGPEPDEHARGSPMEILSGSDAETPHVQLRSPTVEMKEAIEIRKSAAEVVPIDRLDPNPNDHGKDSSDKVSMVDGLRTDKHDLALETNDSSASGNKTFLSTAPPEVSNTKPAGDFLHTEHLLDNGNETKNVFLAPGSHLEHASTHRVQGFQESDGQEDEIAEQTTSASRRPSEQTGGQADESTNTVGGRMSQIDANSRRKRRDGIAELGEKKSGRGQRESNETADKEGSSDDFLPRHNKHGSSSRGTVNGKEPEPAEERETKDNGPSDEAGQNTGEGETDEKTDGSNSQMAESEATSDRTESDIDKFLKSENLAELMKAKTLEDLRRILGPYMKVTIKDALAFKELSDKLKDAGVKEAEIRGMMATENTPWRAFAMKIGLSERSTETLERCLSKLVR